MIAVFVVASVVLLLVAALVLAPFAFTDPDVLDGPLPTLPLLALLIVPLSLAALTAIAGTALVGTGPKAGRMRRELSLRWDPQAVKKGVTLGFGGLVLAIPAALAWTAWSGGDRTGSAVGEEFTDRLLSPGPALVAFAALWLLAPLAEEVLFRGVLWRALEHWRWNRWLIFTATTALFAVAHLELLRTPLLLLLSTPIGLARVVTGNLLACVVAHQVNNFLPATALLLTTTGVW
ncbi:CPBP family intramembrane glutamic endopeptidase [Saccharothrix xinjiangensis]|uniref:CPBP family intramembrane glutamic endopeptidase n=1 Tax=Saccharothrix xinjiangensis TaxID=204798 RepID=A0ABV9XXU2_9PSEU